MKITKVGKRYKKDGESNQNYKKLIIQEKLE